MNAKFALNLISAVVGKKVNVELDKDFLNMLDIAYNDRIKGLERTVLMLRFGQDRLCSTVQIASHLGITKEYAKELLDSGLKNAKTKLNLGYFDEKPDNLRNLCYYFYELLESANVYSKQILERASQIHKTTSFDLNENDPFYSGLNIEAQKTSFFVVLIERLCAIDIEAYPEDRLACLCFLFVEAERKIPSYVPCLVNREINCAKAERKAGLKSWHSLSFTPSELETKLEDVAGLKDVLPAEVFQKYPKVGDVLAYEAAELSPKIGIDVVKAIQQSLIALSDGVWKGWNKFWERYYS